jgi:hypothetical protein
MQEATRQVFSMLELLLDKLYFGIQRTTDCDLWFQILQWRHRYGRCDAYNYLDGIKS